MEALHRISPPLPFNEAERLRALLDSCILDTQQDPAFEAISRAASVLMETPVAAVSLIDQHRQWFKSSVGLDRSSTAREDAFCAYAILQREPLIVLDAREDARFAGNPFVTGEPGARFYVGVPVRSEEGMPLGTLFVIDFTPRTNVDLRVLEMLCDLAETVEALIRVRRTTQYVDHASGLPNQRRFHENAASLRATALLAQEGNDDAESAEDASSTTSSGDTSLPLRGWSSRLTPAGLRVGIGDQGTVEYWAVCVEGVTSACADDWIARGKSVRIDQQLEGIATWLRSAAVTRDGVYRLSARHLGFFVAMPRAAVSRLVHMLTRDLSPLVGAADISGSVGSGAALGPQGLPAVPSTHARSGKTERDNSDASPGELQIVAMRIAECVGVAELITALMAPPKGQAGTPAASTDATSKPKTPSASVVVLQSTDPVSQPLADSARFNATRSALSSYAVDTPVARADQSATPAGAAASADGTRRSGRHASWGSALRAPVGGDAQRLGYDPARDGCQMRVNLCAALAEGFDVSVPDRSKDGDVIALRGAGLQEPSAKAGGFRGAARDASPAEVTLGVAQRRALLDWFSRWWTMERRTSARLQLRGGIALLDQSPQQWLNDLLHVGLLPAQLEVAVPLAALREQFATTQRRVRAWREAGIGVVITGFGAGFDTVRWLPTLPLTGVSFDPRVIDAVRQLPKHARVVQRLVSLAHALGMRVGVDGLQDEAALRIARGLGIDEGSGDAAAGVLAIQDGGAVVPRVDALSTQSDGANGSNNSLDTQGADGVFTRRTIGKTMGARPARRSGRWSSISEREAAAMLRLVGDDPAAPGCQHGDACTAGCIPSRTTTRDSITRASLYPRFKFQS